MLKHDIVEHSVEAFAKEVAARTLDGWAIDPTNPGDTIGFGQCYTVSMFRDESTISRLKVISGNIAESPKATREEILAKARAAKRAKSNTVLNVDEVIKS